MRAFLASLPAMSETIDSTTASMLPERRTALSYFALSMSCFTSAVSASQTYFVLPVSLSVHFATQTESGSQTTPAQRPGGASAPLPRLSVTSPSFTRGFHLPRSGWAPLPMNMPGGSTM